MRGEILTYDDLSGAGLISGHDGARYSFVRADLQQLTPLRPGMAVDFVAEGGLARSIYLLAAGQNGGYAAGGYSEPLLASTDEDLSLSAYFVRAATQKYIDGEGRARRKEFWGFVLFSTLIMAGLFLASMIITQIGMNAGGGFGAFDNPISGAGFAMFVVVCLVAVYFLIPSLTALIRRLHDIGLSGWVILIGLIPYLGGIALLIMALIPSRRKVNKHGLYPKPLS